MAIPTSRTGAAGEFYVAAQLSQRGWDASILLGNAPRNDILAQHESGVTISVQSKAANGGGDFQVGLKGEVVSPKDAREWFVFVSLPTADVRPEFFVIPRNVIAAFAWCGYQTWIRGESRSGRPHQANSMRNLRQRDLAAYRERWDDLLEPPDTIPYWFRGGFWEWTADVGLPPRHPGIVRPDPAFLASLV